MDRDAKFSFQYFSPSIVRAGQYEFCLEYADAQGTILFSGYERGHESGGTINFLSAADWDELYPTRKGQREIIMARLRKYCLSKPYFRHLAPSLRPDGLITGSLLRKVGKIDLAVAIVIALLLLFTVVSTGDPLQFGVWYYLLIPALLVSFGIYLGAPSPYLTGASLAAAVSLLIVWSASGPGSLVGVGHPFSLPFAMAGYVIGLSFARRVGGMAILVLGFLGWSGGFLVTQLLMCRRGFEKFFCDCSIFS